MIYARFCNALTTVLSHRQPSTRLKVSGSMVYHPISSLLSSRSLHLSHASRRSASQVIGTAETAPPPNQPHRSPILVKRYSCTCMGARLSSTLPTRVPLSCHPYTTTSSSWPPTHHTFSRWNTVSRRHTRSLNNTPSLLRSSMRSRDISIS